MSRPSSSPSSPPSPPGPVNRLVIYRPKPGKLAELEAIVKQHGSVLRKVGLITDDPVRVYRGTDLRKPDGAFLVENFHWRDGSAADLAHQTPEVMAVWETMGPHLDDMMLITLDAVD
jgi:quinol monooxygenase YgiN